MERISGTLSAEWPKTGLAPQRTTENQHFLQFGANPLIPRPLLPPSWLDAVNQRKHTGTRTHTSHRTEDVAVKQAKTLTIKIRYPGMEDRSSARSLAVGSDLETSFYPLVSQLLRAAWTEPRPLRLVGVRFSGIEQPSRQLEIFGEVADKKRRLAGVLDKLNARGPLPAVHSGHQLGPPPS